MALFSRSKKADAKAEKPAKVAKPKTEKKAKAVVATPADAGVQTHVDVAHVLRNPRVTEKATMHSAEGVYVFDVATRSNKREIAAAIQKAYNVKPRKVAIVTIHSKNVRNMRTGKTGVKQGGKKAYVYLKKGDSITLF